MLPKIGVIHVIPSHPGMCGSPEERTFGHCPRFMSTHLSPPQTSSAASATVEMLQASGCKRICRHRGAISPPFGARSPCSEDPSQILPSADSQAHVSGIRLLGSSSPPKPLGQSRRLRSRLNHVVFRTPALWTGVDL